MLPLSKQPNFDPDNRRKAGRLQCARTQCQFGEVDDLSKDGCRVVSKKPLKIPEGASINLTLHAEGFSVVVPAHPVMCKPRDDRRFDIGFKFIDPTPEMRRDLAQLAHVSRNSATYDAESAA